MSWMSWRIWTLASDRRISGRRRSVWATLRQKSSSSLYVILGLLPPLLNADDLRNISKRKRQREKKRLNILYRVSSLFYECGDGGRRLLGQETKRKKEPVSALYGGRLGCCFSVRKQTDAIKEGKGISLAWVIWQRLSSYPNRNWKRKTVASFWLSHRWSGR